MSRLLALEWDSREIRAASAVKRGSDIVVEQAFAIPRVSDEESEGDRDSDIGELLGNALAEQGISSVETLVGVGRSNIELREMTLPPAPPEEQPDLVRFQASQAFAAIGDDWPLDFVRIETLDESVKVLAAAVSPKLVSQINEICERGGVTPQRLLLRPFAAASLFGRSGLLPESTCSLMVDLLADEADLTVLSQGQVVFMRTIRLPAVRKSEAQAVAILGELRRTIAAAQNQLAGRRVEKVVICGSDSEHEELRNAVADRLSLEVVTFDPFNSVKMRRGLKKNQPEHAGRFAPLLGMLTDEGAGAAHAIDFLNPRRRPKPPSKRGRNIAIGGAVAAAVLLGVFSVWFRLYKLDEELASVRLQMAELTPIVSASEELSGKVEGLREFEDGDITWLDELREIAIRLPDAEDTILSEISIGAHSPKGGIVTFKGNVRESSMIASFEDSLRYGGNVVSGRTGSVDASAKDYAWVLDTKVVVKPDKHEQGRSLGRPDLASAKSEPKAESDNSTATQEEEKVLEPAVEKPAVEKPAVEKPAVEKPAVEKPAVEEPAVEEPAVAEPAVAEDPEILIEAPGEQNGQSEGSES